MNIREIQNELIIWLNNNFPSSDWQKQFMGIVEEVGELSHSLLKQSQGIRGNSEEHELKAKDAVGDITIYLMALCIRRGWDFQEIVEETWNLVSKRNWKENPTGVKNG